MLNVLLVDDEPLVLEGLRTMINWGKYGFQVCGEASNGSDALRLIQDNKPELVVTDINMPVFSGLELISKSKQTMTKPPKFIILSGYNDFKFAQTAMRQKVKEYILKPIDDKEIEALLAELSITIAEETVAEQNHYIKQSCVANSIVNRLIKGEFSADVQRQARRVMDLHDEVELICILIETAECKVDLKKLLEGYFPRTVAHLFNDVGGRMGILVQSGSISKYTLQETILQFQCELTEDKDSSIAISISDRMRGIRSIQTLYLQAMAAWEMRYYRCNKKVFYFSDLRRKNPHDPVHRDTFGRLLDKVTDNHQDGIEQGVREAFTYFADNCLTVDVVKTHVANLELTLCRKIAEINGKPDTYMLQQRSKYGDLQDLDYLLLQKYVYELCQQAATHLVELQRENEDNTIFKVIHYVDREFRSRLQLQDLAKHFHMNATYLGQLFKKQTGKSYNDYLNQKRIEEAKKLLKRTQLKISDIALQIGYPSTDYFVSKFKILTGVVPSVYKNRDENK